MIDSRYEFNLRQLLLIAQALGDLLPRVFFVGGCTTVLLVDDVAFPACGKQRMSISS